MIDDGDGGRETKRAFPLTSFLFFPLRIIVDSTTMNVWVAFFVFRFLTALKAPVWLCERALVVISSSSK